MLSVSSDQFKLPEIGDFVYLIPGHCDPTVNMYDFMYGYRGDKIEKVIPIEARGRLD